VLRHDWQLDEVNALFTQPFNDLLFQAHTQCYCCAKPFAIHSSTPRLCGKCQKNPPAFNKTYSPFIHQGAIRYLINQLKFKGAYKNSRLLGLLLANYLEKNAELPGLIIPVPLHSNRYKQRGFNQTHEIAKTIAKELDLAIDISCCQRIKNTPHQISLTKRVDSFGIFRKVWVLSYELRRALRSNNTDLPFFLMHDNKLRTNLCAPFLACYIRYS
jgi:hypothetical protein